MAAAEDVELPEKVNLVRFVYEGKDAKDSSDDPHKVLISKVYKAAQLTLSNDRLSVTGYKGFRTARCSHGAHEGALYCEVTVTRMGETGHCRVGWCTRKAELQAPVGYDLFGFCYRDVDGSKVANGLREPYGQPFREGDVVGLYIYLPKGGRTMEPQDKEYARYKGRWMRVEDVESDPEVLPGSVIAFSVNGVDQGVAFRDFKEGTYYPAVSLYTMPAQADGATVTLNFGPHFQYPMLQPQGCPPPTPVSELALPVPPEAALPGLPLPQGTDEQQQMGQQRELEPAAALQEPAVQQQQQHMGLPLQGDVEMREQQAAPGVA